MKKKISFILASFFGAGYSPVAPGTVGSLVTLPFVFALAYFYGSWGVTLLVLGSFALGVLATKEVLKHTKHDPSLVVIDEVAGQSLSFILIADSLNHNTNAWLAYALGFALFRLFDITKPNPVGWADKKILNAWGVMLDDIFAGVYAAVILYIISLYIHIL